MYRVLIVDDDKTVRYILKRYKKWESYGFSIADEACDGKEALRKLASSGFDLLLTDIKMPGMDGIELLKELKIIGWDICVIFLSTHSDFNYAKQGIRLGVFDYMTKPIDDETLEETLTRVKLHLDEKRFKQNQNEDEKKQMDESLRLYYPRNSQKKLSTFLLAGSAEAVREATDIFAELTSVLGTDTFMLGRVLENMVREINEGIYTLFPWLEKIEGSFFEGTMTSIENSDEMQERFLEYVNTMLELVRKYELHQTDGIIKRTIDFIMCHVEDNIKLEMVAREINVSRDYIGKLFKQKTGLNFHDYVAMVKIEHAKCLIKTGCYKTYEVSEMLGYRTHDYFTRLFRNYTGYTPIEFRRMNQ
ncbi:MAG TPA: response regulator [Syntrophomonadaceae bacterium]|nr:response regulator [Syntrophomonadaceae bacterium]